MERPRTSPRNLAHRMGRWSGLHPWRAILAWVAFVAVCFAAGNVIGTTKIDENTSGPGESGHAARMEPISSRWRGVFSTQRTFPRRPACWTVSDSSIAAIEGGRAASQVSTSSSVSSNRPTTGWP